MWIIVFMVDFGISLELRPVNSLLIALKSYKNNLVCWLLYVNVKGGRQKRLPAAWAMSSSGSISCRSAKCGTGFSARGGDRVWRFPFLFTFLRQISTEMTKFCFKLSCLLNVFNFYAYIYKRPFTFHDKNKIYWLNSEI